MRDNSLSENIQIINPKVLSVISRYLFTVESNNFSADEHQPKTTIIPPYDTASDPLFITFQVSTIGTNRPIKITDSPDKIEIGDMDGVITIPDLQPNYVLLLTELKRDGSV